MPYSVRYENSLSEIFETNTGSPQGDCPSALEFTYYLAKTTAKTIRMYNWPWNQILLTILWNITTAESLRMTKSGPETLW